MRSSRRFIDGTDASEYQEQIASIIHQAALEDPGEDMEHLYIIPQATEPEFTREQIDRITSQTSDGRRIG